MVFILDALGFVTQQKGYFKAFAMYVFLFLTQIGMADDCIYLIKKVEFKKSFFSFLCLL